MIPLFALLACSTSTEPLGLEAASKAEAPSVAHEPARDADVTQRLAVAPNTPSADEKAALRRWFPETFLWRPSVLTGPSGEATVDTQLPDTLTTWRILALAHDRRGHQSGATLEVRTALPVNVEILGPSWLYEGDTLDVFARIGTTDAPFSGTVELRTEGPLTGSAGRTVTLEPRANTLVRLPITATEVGEGRLRAVLRGEDVTDAVERTVVIRPQGRPVRTHERGTLSQPYVLTSPEGKHHRLDVYLFPGPVSFLTAEKERLGDRPGVYGFALARHLEAHTGAERDLRLRSWQTLVRRARSSSLGGALVLLTALGPEPHDPAVRAVYRRSLEQVERAQRGDGSWAFRPDAPVRDVILLTAALGRTLPASHEAARRRAAGALERLLPHVEDAHTAAWVLASGLLPDDLRKPLEETLLAQIVTDGDRRRPTVRPDVQGPLGPADPTEQIAVAWLALEPRDDLPWRADLLAELLDRWTPTDGLGATWPGLLGLEAIHRGLPPLEEPVQVTLEGDRGTRTTTSLDPARPTSRAAFHVDGPGPFILRATPPHPGLLFNATHTVWLGFTGTEKLDGIDVQVHGGPFRAGHPGSVRIVAAAPGGTPLVLEQGLPAGTHVEIPASTSASLTDRTIHQDRVILHTRPFQPGETMELELRVIPAYAGRFTTPALVVRAGHQKAEMAPLRWVVSR